MKTARLGKPGPLIAVLILALLFVAFAWYVRPAVATTDPSLLKADNLVGVERRSYGWVFSPQGGPSALGMVFYPGARVPPEAYAYLGQALARAGFTVVIVAFPLNFAVFAPSKAQVAIKAQPEVKAWVLGGHSLGGAMAAGYCASKPFGIAGLLLLASYPGGGSDLSASTLPVLSISASNDGLATPAKVRSARRLLPSNTRYVEIAGGTHAQFAEYGLQDGDGIPSVAFAVQRSAVIEEALGLMNRILASLR